MDWADVARGGAADNDAFAALDPAQRSREIDEAIGHASTYQLRSPAACRNIAAVALHFMDAHDIPDPVQRATLTFMLGSAFLLAGDEANALPHFEKVLRYPPEPDLAIVRGKALMNYAALISRTDPDQALELLSIAMKEARKAEDFYDSATIAISMGSLLRAAGKLTAAEQVYRQGIDDIARLLERAGTEEYVATLAPLHGNLGNLLLDDLEQYAEAADHFAQAAVYFDQIGQKSKSAKRFFQSVRAKLLNGEIDSLHVLETGVELINEARESFHDLLLDGRWVLAPSQDQLALPQDLRAWDSFFARVLEHHRSQLSATTECILTGARVLLHALLDEKRQAIVLAHDPRFGPLPDSPLKSLLEPTIMELAQDTGCHGIRWPLAASLTDGLSRDALARVRQMYASETAAIRLLDLAVRDEDPGPQPPVIIGIGAVSADPPDWLEVTDPAVRERYQRFRDRWPTESALETFGANALIPSEDAGTRGLEARLRARVQAADLLCHTPGMVDSRLTLAQWIHRSGAGAGADRLRAFTEIIETARKFAERFPDLLVQADLMLATLMKESLSGDEDSRLEEAARIARRAFATAEQHGLEEQLPELSFTLGNALIEHPARDMARLDEAKAVLRRGIDALHAQPPESADRRNLLEGVLLNSLGTAFTMSGEAGQVADFQEAVQYLRLALEVRERADDTVGTLRTIGNLLGALLLSDMEADESSAAEISRLAARARDLGEQVGTTGDRLDLQAQSIALINIASALQEAEHQEAMEVALAAVAAARAGGPTRYLIDTLHMAARMHFKSANKETALILLEEAVEVIGSFRLDSRESSSRAELSERFLQVHHFLEQVLEELGRPASEQWWAIERHTGRTILEDMRQGAIPAAAEQVLALLEDKLPADTVVLHVYMNWREEIAAYAIERQGTEVRIRSVGRPVSLLELVLACGGKLGQPRMEIRLYEPDEEEFFGRQLRWLGNRFLGPVMDDLDMSGKSRITFVPGTYSSIPWHAVPVPGTATPLGCTVEVSYVPNTTVLGDLLARTPRTITNAAFVACDPNSNLREHIKECRNAFFTMPADNRMVYTDASRPLTKQIVLTAMGEADLFHFSGHSVFATRQPTESGLLLSDGLLTIPEISAALGSHAPSLVFLSSCQSAAADINLEDQTTLSSIFLRHGTSAVIGSTWKVPDKVAALTARKFYAHLQSSSPGTALTKARTELMNVFPGGYWAAFRMQGW
jgi:tetratricopeptide (TPR) repeat protein